MKFDAHTAMRLVRESLESVLSPEAASAIVFEALDAGRVETLPDNPEAFMVFVRGPVRRAVEKRIGTGAGDGVVQDVAQLLEGTGTSVGGADVIETTLQMPIVRGPVAVVAFARSPSIAIRLRAALGGDAVLVTVATTVLQAEAACDRVVPEVVLIDGDAVDASNQGKLGTLLQALSPLTTVVIWATTDSPARDLVADLRARGASIVALDSSGGVEPLLDVIRARQRTSGPPMG
ncbi:MAG: hypothetical protein KC416_08230 [Myxococcales bacterium]|nr:hypothetical protein [Myxococcales bacterium]